MKPWTSAGLIPTVFTAIAVCAQALAQTPAPDQAHSPVSPAASATSAATGCPALTEPLPTPALPTPGQQTPTGFQQQLQQRLTALDALAESCLDSPRFHAQRGAVLQMLAQPAAAVEALERSLLLDPEQPGTQLDYALALRDAGDYPSAHALLQQISQRTDLPPGLQPVLQSQLVATLSKPAGAWQQRLKLSSAVGTDSNLNNATADSNLTLTFPEGNVTLPLADASRAQSGMALLTTLQYQAVKPVNDQLWVLQAELRDRKTNQPATNYGQYDLTAQWLQAPEAPSQWQVRLGYGDLHFGGSDLLQSLRAGVVHQWKTDWPQIHSVCRPLAGLEFDRRHYPTITQLDGLYTGLVVSIACDPAPKGAAGGTTAPKSDSFDNPGFSIPRFSLQLRSGQDRASSAQRPGGNNTSTELRSAGYGRALGMDWLIEYGVMVQKDSVGYSPLLGNNAIRTSQRQTLRLELARQLPKTVLGGAQWFVSTEINQQRSSLDAFTSKGQAFYSGLRWDLY